MNKRTKLRAGIIFISLAALTSCDDDKDDKATYILDSDSSVVEWHGAGPAAEHNGSFAVQSSNISVIDNKITGGTFSIPIASIQDFDLPDSLKSQLLEHLQSADFFDIANYAEASFTITSVSAYTASGSGANGIAGANVRIVGDFTMIGKTLSIEFPAKVNFMGSSFDAEALTVIDRTKWGMDYASDPALGDHYIYPNVDLHFRLTGNKQ